jgi:lipopolysaccharide transport system permease protein
MSTHPAPPTSLVSVARSAWGARSLIRQLVEREIAGRYKGSVMGMVWSLINPILMLAVYTFFFSTVFKARWAGAEESRTQFAVVLFAGLIVHGLFAEIVMRAPVLVVGNANFVKRVVFPLEILPIVSAGAAMFHAGVSICVLLAAFLLFNGYLPATVVFIPLVIAPLLVLTLGIAWALASLGVFVRDLGQVVGLLTTVLLFMSPVFYPIESLPVAVRPWMQLNPLTFIIEQTREVLIWGRMPDWLGLALYTLVAIAVAWLGYAWFQKTRKGFADVL